MVNLFGVFFMFLGDKIPNLEADAFHDGKFEKINFSNLRGKWLILFFYPADFTFVCPTELEELADNYTLLQKMGVEVASISRDSVYSHKAWHEKSREVGKVKFPMVGDVNGEITNAFGVMLKGEGVAVRATFVVDPRQKIVALEMHHNSIGRSVSELIRKIKAAQIVEKRGVLCPASWEPGKKVLFKPRFEKHQQNKKQQKA